MSGTDLQNASAEPVQRIDKYTHLGPGSYWAAIADIESDDSRYVCDPIPAGQMHLLEKVKTADDHPHTVVLAAHPSQGENVRSYEFLVDNFVAKFQLVEDPLAVRDSEIQAIQAEIDGQRERVDRMVTDPQYALDCLQSPDKTPSDSDDDADEAGLLSEYDAEAGLPDLSSSRDLSVQDADQSHLDRLQRQLKNQSLLTAARKELIKNESNRLMKLTQRLAPFYAERANQAMAAASTALDEVEGVMKAVMSMELYTGKDVKVETLRTGEPAPADQPLTLRQRLCYVDEESLINSAFDGADFNDFPEFAEQLANDDTLLNRIMPEVRCVVPMRHRRTKRDYGDPWESAQKNQINQETFLLVRNGESVYAVFSPLTYAERLFPSRDDLDRPFRGSRFDEDDKITLEDVRYADAKKALENSALMYKRFLILLWGLYDRTDILGAFALEEEYGHLNLLSGEVQQKCFHFIYDDEPEQTLSENRPGFDQWIKNHNAHLQSGSLVVCYWGHRGALTPDSAPGCFTRHSFAREKHVQIYSPASNWEILVAERRGKDLIVRPEVSGERYDKDQMEVVDRTFNATVNLSAVENYHTRAYLCLDTVTLDELDYYIHSRQQRRDYLQYIPLLIAAREAVATRDDEVAGLRHDIRDAAASAVLDGQQGGSLDALIEEALRAYRVANRWRRPPGKGTAQYRKHLDGLLEQIWRRIGKGADRVRWAEQICEAEGRTPLRLVVTGNNHLVLYATASGEEEDNRLGPHPWVQRIRLVERKTRISPDTRRWVLDATPQPGEHELHRWASMSDWENPPAPGHALSYDQVDSVLDLAHAGAEAFLELGTDEGEAKFQEIIQGIRAHNAAGRRGIVDMADVYFPLGVVRYIGEPSRRRPEGQLYMVYWQCRADYYLWLRSTLQGRTDRQQAIRELITSLYKYPESHLEDLTQAATYGELMLMEIGEALKTPSFGETRFDGYFPDDDKAIELLEAVYLPSKTQIAGQMAAVLSWVPALWQS